MLLSLRGLPDKQVLDTDILANTRLPKLIQYTVY